MRAIGVMEIHHDYHRDMVTVFIVSRLRGEPKVDQIEIGEAQWFHGDHLPINLTDLAASVLEQHLAMSMAD